MFSDNNSTSPSTGINGTIPEPSSSGSDADQEAKDSAKNAGIAYLKAQFACDRSMIDQLSMVPMTDQKFIECKKTIKLGDGRTISRLDIDVSVRIIVYDIDDDPRFGKIETAAMYPSFQYEGKDLGLGPANLVVLNRFPDVDNQWKSLK